MDTARAQAIAAEVDEHLRKLRKDGMTHDLKITAIKKAREIEGLSLVDAKILVEQHCNGSLIYYSAPDEGDAPKPPKQRRLRDIARDIERGKAVSVDERRLFWRRVRTALDLNTL